MVGEPEVHSHGQGWTVGHVGANSRCGVTHTLSPNLTLQYDRCLAGDTAAERIINNHMTLDIAIIPAADWPALVELFARCNRADNIELPVYLDGDWTPTMAAARIGETLVGGVVMYGYFAIEAVIAVDPAWRRRGFGRQLIEQIERWAYARGGSWIALADEAGSCVAPFVAALDLHRLNVEVELQLDPAQLPPLPEASDEWQVRLAERDDVDTLTSIIASAFGDPVEQVSAFVSDRITHPRHRFVIAEMAGQPVAALRLLRTEQTIIITTFGVRRDLQGRGYGKLLLLTTLHRLQAAGYQDIRIEVEEQNTAAYHLYRSSGFVPRRRLGQYGRPR